MLLLLLGQAVQLMRLFLDCATQRLHLLLQHLEPIIEFPKLRCGRLRLAGGRGGLRLRSLGQGAGGPNQKHRRQPSQRDDLHGEQPRSFSDRS